MKDMYIVDLKDDGIAIPPSASGFLSTVAVEQPKVRIVRGASEKISYDAMSKYLLRGVDFILYNKAGHGLSFAGAKLTISGSKYIGIKQDNFSIRVNNANYAYLAAVLSAGYRYAKVVTTLPGGKETTVFNGEIRLINTERSTAVERDTEFICLTRASDILANMVIPISIHSSMNVWSIWDAMQELTESIYDETGENIKISSQVEETLKKINIKDVSYSANKAPVDIIEDFISMANDRLDPTSNAQWFDYKLTSSESGSGIIDIFSNLNKDLRGIRLAPESGLLGTPRITETEITFDHIYNADLTPGRVVYLPNELVSTAGATSAFIWAWDPKSEYLITEVRYSFETYPNRFTLSARARSYNKYRNFTSVSEVYEAEV